MEFLRWQKYARVKGSSGDGYNYATLKLMEGALKPSINRAFTRAIQFRNFTGRLVRASSLCLELNGSNPIELSFSPGLLANSVAASIIIHLSPSQSTLEYRADFIRAS